MQIKIMAPETLQAYAEYVNAFREKLFAEDTAGISAEAEQLLGLAIADLSSAYHHLLLAKYRQMQAMLAKRGS